MATYQYLDEGNTEAQDRLATSFLLAQTSPGLATTGVLSGLAVTQTATASDSVLIASGAAPIQASVITGVALMVNDTAATLEVLTTNPVGALPRHDIVVMDSVTKATAVVLGTPNATPSDPAVPTTACALARLRQIADGQPGHGTIPTSAIDDLRTYTTLAGTLPVVSGLPAAFDGNVSLTSGSQILRIGDQVTVMFTATRAAGFSGNPGVCVLPWWARPALGVTYVAGASFGTGQTVVLRVTGTTGWVELPAPIAGHTVVSASFSFVGS